MHECNIDQHLQAERNMIFLAFGYDHQTYARYNTYQNAYLSNLKPIHLSAFHNLKIKGIGRSIIGEKFSAIHYNLLPEFFNKEVKGNTDPNCSGFSKDIDTVNC